MNTTDAIWIPAHYRQPRRFSWVRAAGGPQMADWIAGAVVAALVLGVVTLTRSTQHDGAAPTTVAAENHSTIDAARVVYASSPVTVDK